MESVAHNANHEQNLMGGHSKAMQSCLQAKGIIHRDIKPIEPYAKEDGCPGLEERSVSADYRDETP
jgi:hypothetical protein